MFEITGYAKDVECPHCDKITECVTVKCKMGSFEGPMCAKCLFRQAKVRAGAKKPQPQTNGEIVTRQ